jgi:hypothetical protein
MIVSGYECPLSGRWFSEVQQTLTDGAAKVGFGANAPLLVILSQNRDREWPFHFRIAPKLAFGAKQILRGRCLQS